jgi:diguanylate cyclase (GGDEF)-like protein
MDERRHEQRHKTLRSGKIIFNHRRSVIDCLVRNLSDGGTCLEVNSAVGIPATFDLSIDGEEGTHACQRIWESETRVGVEFSAAEHAQDVHPSLPLAVTSQGDDGDAANLHIFRGELITLCAALNEVPMGIVLLDHDTRAQFINRAFRQMWRLPDAKADSKPPFIALMYHGRDTLAYAVPADAIDSYIAARVAHVKSGDAKPVEVRLASGEILRLQCTVLPNGGRMLCYTYVTDIVSHADELETLRAALDQIQQGIILLDPMLNARFMNRAVRDLWKVPDEQADRHPPYIELVSDARNTGTFNVSPEELGNYIADRVAVVRAGDPTPVDIPHGDGRTIRAQCGELPNGGRMLTYTDVTDLVERAAQFEELAAVDELSGLYNRRHFNILAASEWSRFQRYHRPFCVLLLDIDHFKELNDRYGHACGDRAVVEFAKLCEEEKRSIDIVSRLGGDEFAILLPETDLAKTRIVAERLLDRISRSTLRGHGEQDEAISLSASIGIAAATLSMSGFEALLRLADQALYRAKSAGRNCVVAAEQPAGADLRAAAE